MLLSVWYTSLPPGAQLMACHCARTKYEAQIVSQGGMEVREEDSLEVCVLFHVRFIFGPEVGSVVAIVIGMVGFLSALLDVSGDRQALL